MIIQPLNHTKTKRSNKGFTLIELLVVIAIIALLAGVSYAPIISFLDKGRETESKQMAKDLEIAITGFLDDYSHLPYAGTLNTDSDTKVVTDTAAFLDVLMGNEDVINDRGQVYFSAKPAKGNKNGLIMNGDNVTKLVDHWRNPFVIVLDTDGDGIISEEQIYSGSIIKQNKDTAIIATGGKDRLLNNEHDIKSW